MSSELGLLTKGEHLFLQRRRLGLTQVEMAEYKSFTHWSYVKKEESKKKETGKLIRLTPFETCLLYRRRTGFTQAQVAAEMGITRKAVNKMERGIIPCDELIWYWEA